VIDGAAARAVRCPETPRETAAFSFVATGGESTFDASRCGRGRVARAFDRTVAPRRPCAVAVHARRARHHAGARIRASTRRRGRSRVESALACKFVLVSARRIRFDAHMEADYVVVGAGSAGCALAARLAAPGRTVILVEAGERRDNLYTRIPAGAMFLVGNPAYDVPVVSEPDPTANRRRITWSTARVVGGGSTINGLVYSRGWAQDYDDWAALGAHGWSWSDVAPYFERLECWDDEPLPGRGRAGPLHVRRARSPFTLADRFVQACTELGMPSLDDVNAPRPDGAGITQVTMNGGRRWGAADAYLKPHLRNRSLTLLTRAKVLRLQMDGARCIGVFARSGGRELQIRARSEVILCAGTFGSPKLLMQSGIGAPGLLEVAGLRPLHALHGVGANLSDHVGVQATAGVSERTLSSRDRRPLSAMLAGLQWLASRGGVLATPIVLGTAYARSDESLADPDLQLQFTAASFESGDSGELRLRREFGVTTSVNVRRPRARGRVRLTSADADAPLRVEHLSLIDADEVHRLVAGLKLLRRLYGAPAFAPVVTGELAPGPGIDSDEQLEAYVRAASFPQYHPVGTCRLGAPEDEDAVVGPRLHVRGIRGLRVADASVMPFVPSSNTNGPSIMIGERAADFVIEDERR
jgi:choline dehydrogenase